MYHRKILANVRRILPNSNNFEKETNALVKQARKYLPRDGFHADDVVLQEGQRRMRHRVAEVGDQIRVDVRLQDLLVATHRRRSHCRTNASSLSGDSGSFQRLGEDVILHMRIRVGQSGAKHGEGRHEVQMVEQRARIPVHGLIISQRPGSRRGGYGDRHSRRSGAMAAVSSTASAWVRQQVMRAPAAGRDSPKHKSFRRNTVPMYLFPKFLANVHNCCQKPINSKESRLATEKF